MNMCVCGNDTGPMPAHCSEIGATETENEVAGRANGARYVCVSFPFTFLHNTTKAATTSCCWSIRDKNAGKFLARWPSSILNFSTSSLPLRLLA